MVLNISHYYFCILWQSISNFLTCWKISSIVVGYHPNAYQPSFMTTYWNNSHTLLFEACFLFAFTAQKSGKLETIESYMTVSNHWVEVPLRISKSFLSSHWMTDLFERWIWITLFWESLKNCYLFHGKRQKREKVLDEMKFFYAEQCWLLW